MARAESTDFLHSMKFAVTATKLDGTSPLVGLEGRSVTDQGGFSACTTPEMTVEAVEYKEGTMIYTRKYPGNPSMSDLTLSRGVALKDSVFWNWTKQVVEGVGDYRVTLDIRHQHRAEALSGRTVKAARLYKVEEAFPMRCKVAADLDATASEVSIAELDISYERFDVLISNAP